MTDLIIGIGKLFTFSYKILPIVGEVVDWLLLFTGCIAFIYWCVRIIGFGQEDKEYSGDHL
ncbi:MAG: hypothetical protein LBT29_02250 [Flavobacteriaceae bacterium]|jgi:hypothetical protein|nr:hypothetical protein [Flavobacteriaceae bacterium]